jgi:hypothetical protein
VLLRQAIQLLAESVARRWRVLDNRSDRRFTGGLGDPGAIKKHCSRKKNSTTRAVPGNMI